MTETVTVNCQIPQTWKAKIQRLAAERKKELTDIIYEALAQYLGEDVEATNTRLLTLQAEVLMLQKQVAELSTTVKKVQQQLLVPTSPLSISHPYTHKPNEITLSEADDLIEDEPDEILYDFLPPEER